MIEAYRSLQGPSPQMRGRLTRSVVDPAAVLLRNASRSLAVMVRQKNQKKKEKKKSSKGCAEPAFPKPANFLGEIAFFAKNVRFVQLLGGGPQGSAAGAGFSEGGQKHQKMGRNRPFRHVRLKISNRNAVFLSRGLPGRTSQLFLPHLVLRFLRSEPPKPCFRR